MRSFEGVTPKNPGELHVLRLAPYYYLPGRTLSRRELQYEPIGGMQVQITQTVEELDKLGIWQSVVLSRRPGLPGRMAGGRRATLRLLRLPIAPMRTRTKGYVGLLVSWGMSVTLWCLLRRLRGEARQFSLIHVHCSELPWTFVFAIIARALLRRPIVLTIHCSAIATFHPDTLMGRLLIGPARLAERFAVGRADAVVVLTERVRDVYVSRGLAPTSRVHVVPDGVRLEYFGRTADKPRRPAEQPEEPATVLYCGRFAPEKGWADFVAAAERLITHGCSARFVLCGDGNEMPRCRRDLLRRGLAGRVELLGHLDRRQVAAIMAQATVVVVPSLHEELGGTVLEALASGRAVVATQVGGLPEVVVDHVTGLLVPPACPQRLAEAVSLLLDDPAKRARLGAMGAREVTRYDAGRLARQMLDLYKEVADGGTAREAATNPKARILSNAKPGS